MLLRDRGMTPDQVDGCPAEFIDEVVAELTAAADHQLFDITDADTATKQRQIRRKSEIRTWREAQRDDR